MSLRGFDARRDPGPRVARLFGTAVALLWLAAWWSWAIQAFSLVGRHGLLPLAEFFSRALVDGGATPLTAPSVFWLAPNDWAIAAALGMGIVCATCAVFDVLPKTALATSALLYVSFMAPAAPFLPVLADRLLLECTALFLLMRRNTPGAAMHWLARGLIFKLYSEIGLAQWQDNAGAWRRGIGLGDFLQSTPLPTPLGWYMAHLPEGLLSLSSKVAVLIIVFVPVLVFGTRWMRLTAAVCLTLLQVAVVLLCNYGLFAWTAAALHLFLLTDSDVALVQQDITRLSPMLARVFGRLTRKMATWQPWGRLAPLVGRIRAQHPVAAPALHHGGRGLLAMTGAAAYLVVSLAALGPSLLPPSWRKTWPEPIAGAAGVLGPWHLVNTYAQLTTVQGSRQEPELEVMVNNVWQPLHLWHQPGDLWDAPKFVAPHQPRLDVELSAFGRRGQLTPLPRFVGRLMETLCDDPVALQRLFTRPLPSHPQAVRIKLYAYAFTTLAEHKDTGSYWSRNKIADGPRLVCASAAP